MYLIITLILPITGSEEVGWDLLLFRLDTCTNTSRTQVLEYLKLTINNTFFMFMGQCILVYTDHINTNEMQFFALYLVSKLYMFRTPFAFIIRSTINCSSSHWCFS